MTVKTYDQLIASFPDNNVGLINPVDIRNLVDSVELKYDNWTVVKPGQPTGNKFPDPSGGQISLPDNTVWVINGQVTVDYPILVGDNVTIVGISGSYVNDQILLDPAAGAVALLNCLGDESIVIRNVGLLATGGTGRLLDFADPAGVVFSECIFASDDFGTIDFAGGTGEVYFVDRCINFASDQPLQLTGSGGNIIFDGMRSGAVNNTIQFDFQGTFTAVFIRNCYNAAASAMFQIDEATTSVGVISNNAVDPGLEIVTGVDQTSENWTFFGNSGIANTVIGGSLDMGRNSTSTHNPGLGLWAAVIGNGLDTLAQNPTRIQRTSALTIGYTGNESYKANITVALSIRRATGSTPTPFSIGVFKNGKLITTPKTVSIASITRVATLATATLSSAFPLVNGMEVTVSGANQAQYNGTFFISGVAGLTFQYTMASDPGASATGTLLAVVPIEKTLPQGIIDTPNSITLHVETTLENGDIIKPYIRPDASGAVDAVVESLFFKVE